MLAVDIIRKKRDGAELTDDEIGAFVSGATSGVWPKYQLSAMLMAIVLRGMSTRETATLTRAMVASGDKLDLSDLPGYKVDKHSTGGVGDKTSIILAPLVAACGPVVPMMSGRGLDHTGGTLDKLESIPGFRVDLSEAEFRVALRKFGCGLIGQTDRIAPADKVLYALRDVTATVESIPLITASIMSKKIAEGIEGLVLDVKCGTGAFMKDLASAKELAQSLVAIGQANGVETTAVISGMDEPLGNAIGNSLEIMECVETLKGNGPADLEQLSVNLAAQMLNMSDKGISLESATKRIRSALSDGRGLEKLKSIIEGQGGDPGIIDDYSKLPLAEEKASLRAERGGHIQELHAERLGRAAMALGAGRAKVSDAIDHGVGIVLRAKVGDRVNAGDELAVAYYRDRTRLAVALELWKNAIKIGDSVPRIQKQILDTVGA